MNHKVFFLFASLFYVTTLMAQLGGRTTYQFLNLVNSPRQAALGGKVVTNYDYDPTQGLFNPAAINPEMDNQLSLNYVNYIGDVSYGSAAYAYLWDRRTQVIHTGITYVNYGQFDGYDEMGMQLKILVEVRLRCHLATREMWHLQTFILEEI
jgi:hypothetical protein